MVWRLRILISEDSLPQRSTTTCTTYAIPDVEAGTLSKQPGFQEHPTASRYKVTMYINTQSSEHGQTKYILLQRLYSILTLHGLRLNLAALLPIL